MKCTYTSKNGQLMFEFEAADAKDLFAQRSIVENHDEECCGVCKCPHIRCEVRKSGEYTYYEMRFQNSSCGARLEFGQNKDMKNLFVKRSGHPATNGWYIYQGQDKDQEHEEAPARQPQAQTNGHAGPRTPIPQRNGATPNGTAKPSPTPSPIDDPHTRTIAGLGAATDARKADEWLAWGSKSLRTAAQKAEQEQAHKAALHRIARGATIPF